MAALFVRPPFVRRSIYSREFGSHTTRLKTMFHSAASLAVPTRFSR
jgi:hypothetical protein